MRQFLNRLFPILFLSCSFSAMCGFAADPLYELDLTVARQGFNKKMCWVHARAGAIPAGVPANPGRTPLVVMTLQKLQLSGSDIFYGLNEMRSKDLGATWTAPQPHSSFARRGFAWKGKSDLEITVCDFTPKWHANSQRILGTGHTVIYENNRVMHVRPRQTGYSVYDPQIGQWSPWKTLTPPDGERFENCGAGSVQRVDLASGDVLLPVYFKKPQSKQYATTVFRCGFDGGELKYKSHGVELSVPIKRGLYEPSLTKFAGRYFLTMRNDDRGYVSVSKDGVQFSQPIPWRFDDGAELGNYNTQQHWVTHRDALFLVYTRRGAANDHVMRHRAPLFIARVDADSLRVIRASEQVLVPEKGARLGNFGVVNVSAAETWVTVTEWMQGPGPNYSDQAPLIQRGADNRVWVAKLKWTKPNAVVD